MRVISYGHGGHGRSGAAVFSSYTIDRFADDFAHVLRVAEVTGSLKARTRQSSPP